MHILEVSTMTKKENEVPEQPQPETHEDVDRNTALTALITLFATFRVREFREEETK
jgi:hypothetical protein